MLRTSSGGKATKARTMSSYMTDGQEKPVKTDFDFGYLKWKEVPLTAKLTLERQKGDILDVGCSSCQLTNFLRERGWNGRYYGIDIVKYDGVEYPEKIDLQIGDALKLEFPEVDTVVMYDILEHVDDPGLLLRKALKAARRNVLVKVPLRNEEMWEHGVVEPHQKDRSHKHSGFSREEVSKLVEQNGGRILDKVNLEKMDATTSVNLWHSSVPKRITYLMSKLFKSRTYHAGFWCEIVRAA